MKKVVVFIASLIIVHYSVAQQKSFCGAFSHYSYSLFARKYNSYPVDFKVFDTLLNANYFSIFLSRQHKFSEIEYELMPFYYFKSCFSVYDAPTNTFAYNDFSNNYAGYINMKYKYFFLTEEKKLKPIMGLTLGIQYFQRVFSTYANSYLNKKYSINDITLGLAIGGIAGFNFKATEKVDIEISLPYYFMLINLNAVENKNPTLTRKERHLKEINTVFFENSYYMRLGIKINLNYEK